MLASILDEPAAQQPLNAPPIKDRASSKSTLFSVSRAPTRGAYRPCTKSRSQSHHCPGSPAVPCPTPCKSLAHCRMAELQRSALALHLPLSTDSRQSLLLMRRHHGTPMMTCNSATVRSQVHLEKLSFEKNQGTHRHWPMGSRCAASSAGMSGSRCRWSRRCPCPGPARR